MMGKKRIKPKKKKAEIGGHDVTKNVEKEGGTDGEYPVFSFKHCDDNRYCLWELDENELKQLMRFFKKMESMRWVDVKRHRGFRWETYEQSDVPGLPKNLPPDAKIIHLKVTKPFVIFGYRIGGVFHIVWFDPDHNVHDMS